MSNSYGLKRVLWLSKIHIYNRWRLYIASYAVVLLIMLMIIFLENTSVLPSIVYVLLMLATILQASSYYSSWHDKGQAFFYLNLPAKTTEKFTVLILFTLLLFIPVVSFVLVGSSYFLSFLIDGSSGVQTLNNEYFDLLREGMLQLLLGVIIIFQSIYLFGSVAFNKRQLVASSIILIIFVFIIGIVPYYVLINSEIGKIQINPVLFNSPDGWYTNNANFQDIQHFRFQLTPFYTLINQLVWAVLSVGVYVGVYYKLKEKEV